jgi:hypothetical protein
MIHHRSCICGDAITTKGDKGKGKGKGKRKGGEKGSFKIQFSRLEIEHAYLAVFAHSGEQLTIWRKR